MKKYIMAILIWFLLTNLFDLVAYLKDGGGLVDLLQAYNILTGNTWLLVVLSALLAPYIVMELKNRKILAEKI